MTFPIRGIAAGFAMLVAASPAFAQAPPPTPAIPAVPLSILVVDPVKLHRDPR